MAGNDKLHSLQLSVYINLSKPAEMPPRIKKEKKGDLIAADSLMANRITQPLLSLQHIAPPLFPFHKSYAPTTIETVSVTFQEVSFSDTAIDSSHSDPTTQVQETAEEGVDYWDKLALEAWNQGKVFYYRPQAGDTYEDLFARFRISETIVKRVNNLTGDKPPTGGEIVLPDLRAHIGQMEDEAIIEEDQSEMVQREAQAIKEGKYVYYHVTKTDDLISVAARYKIRASTIKRLNFLRDNYIYVDSYLRLPDIGISSSD